MWSSRALKIVKMHYFLTTKFLLQRIMEVLKGIIFYFCVLHRPLRLYSEPLGAHGPPPRLRIHTPKAVRVKIVYFMYLGSDDEGERRSFGSVHGRFLVSGLVNLSQRVRRVSRNLHQHGLWLGMHDQVGFEICFMKSIFTFVH